MNEDYVVSRLQAAAEVPINVNSLLEALQLLRLDPLIANISAELGKGISPGNSTLDVAIEEADPFFFSAKLDNSRTPSVGSNRRRIGLTHRNLLGFGDRFQVGYTNTEGSDGVDLSYSFPVNASNGKLSFTFGTNSNDIIEEPFNPLDIESESRYYELSFRQPVILKPQQELTLAISFSHQESETSLFDTPFPLSRSANIWCRSRFFKCGGYRFEF
ncbi:MAG: ShlB/FhaC/HecB family hemolysin secretion/activation protein [Xenococcaceae cyanobacterium]